MRSRFAFYLVCGVLGTALMALPAIGHHGWGGNMTEEFELTGTLEGAVSLSGPHATMKIKAADGQIWDVTLAPEPRTSRSGLTANAIPAGAKVTIQGHRNRDPKRFEVKTERVIYNGKTFAVYPDRT